MEYLNKNGYIILKNVVDTNRIKYVRSLIKKNTVNYFRLKSYLDNDMINNVNKELNLNIDYTKYRVSNNNNSTDAASFHRDLQSYTNKSPRVFTVLSYLEKSRMEVIPTSHKNVSVPLYNIMDLMNKRITLDLEPGDILIFYATLVHRGIFYKSRNKNRRLIQLFDCININDIEKYTREILHIPCNNNCSSLVNNINVKLNKYQFFSEILNFISTIITLSGYGYPYNGLRFITNDTDIKYLSTEANKTRLYNIHNKDYFSTINLYIVNFRYYKDIDSTKRNTYLFFSFGIPIILIIILCILIGFGISRTVGAVIRKL
jgi:ectoine hydroxylase-related dioxygenase (phytanoyl-CoA dioxygenase family)